jgi:hypothetical protein
LGFDVVLGADCFYSSEAFDGVLATAHWILHRPVQTDRHIDQSPPPAPACAGEPIARYAPAPPPELPPLLPTPLRPRQFLVTYQERSAGRNVRALLKKWRLRGEAVALSTFIPAAMADDPRFASIHMLVLTPAL